MTQLCSFNDMVGKTITKVHDLSQGIFLLFDDDTFLVLHKNTVPQVKRYDALNGRDIDKLSLYELPVLALLGVITREQARRIQAARKAEIAEEAQRCEIQLLKELKNKYPDIVNEL